MNRGYIKYFRKWTDEPWWQNLKLSHFFTYCLTKASHKSRDTIVGYKNVSLRPGQFIFGRKIAAQETGLSEQEIRTCIKYLTENGKINCEPTSKFSIITVLDWSTYQDWDGSSNQQVTSTQPANNHRQECKEFKESKENNDIELYEEIISYLNQEAHTDFKPSNEKTQQHIDDRLKEGFTIEDFKRVISIKSREWSGTEFKKYLRPETLFGDKFESYLNQPDEIGPRPDQSMICKKCEKKVGGLFHDEYCRDCYLEK